MQIKTIRGTKDILPNEAAEWVVVETAARELFSRYGYAEIRTPVIEETALFSRSVGETSDIVQKQMYSFKDRGERSITLRPEGTAPVVRAYLENNINNKQGLTKLFYMGPMFRAERPQA
ncbi:MAG: histidine--tRNA ligase, partial [Candidatus Omnitrophica bacterium CG12_big_fil_rev_8_21_14_0_65_43_15]